MKIYEDVYVKQVVAVRCDLYPNLELNHNNFSKNLITGEQSLSSNAYATLTVDFGYGSKWDGMKLELDLSDKAADEILKMLIDKYGKKIIDSRMIDRFK
jgi:hypothetical protein